MEKIKVAIRVRPLNKRELELKTESIITVDNKTIIVNNAIESLKKNHKNIKTFTFDYCFDSSSPNSLNFASQEIVFKHIGVDLMNNAFSGFNACIFAYGQTSSGKSYSMTGTPENKGLIPRICEGIFDKIQSYVPNSDEDIHFKIEASYMEIYNEKVLDLLDPKGHKQNLKVREHKLLGPYVDGLSQLAVSTYKDIEILLNEGNKSRTVAATNMNAESSRSHAVFSIKLSQIITDKKTGITGEKVSKLSLVDLAGSEKASKTGAEGERLKEGSNINKSLHTLGLVISALAESTKSNSKEKHIPYRDSVLTWLLKDSLGGNSKTVMIATISPSGDNYEETMSTLRYADRAKRIENHAIVNEDPNAKIIRELRDEIEILKKELEKAKARVLNGDDLCVAEKLNESEKLFKEISRPWDEKLAESELRQKEFEKELQKMGISVETSGIKVETEKFYLVNMNDDPAMNELLVYYLKEVTVVGRCDSTKDLDIQLNGLGISDEHCIFEIRQNEVYLKPLNNNMKLSLLQSTFVNKSLIRDETQLHHGDRILIGLNNFFRLNCPKSCQSPQRSQNSDFNIKDYYPSLIQNNLQDEKQYLYEKLDEQLIRANTLIHEANSITNEMKIQLKFFITLQIPLENLIANNKPAVLVKRETNIKNKFIEELWSLEKFKNRLIEMREMFNEFKNRQISNEDDNLRVTDRFNESLHNHTLIGVAKIYLEAFFYDCVFNYNAPIISQQGEIVGCLKIQLKHENLPMETHDEQQDEDNLSSNQSTIDTGHLSSSDLSEIDSDKQKSLRRIKCIISVIEAYDLKISLKNNSFLEYKFWNEPENIVAPVLISDDDLEPLKCIKFNHTKEYVVKLNAKFADYCADNSLAIQLWGHLNDNENDETVISQLQTTEDTKINNLINEWNQVKKSIDLWIEILELDKNGQWTCVDIKSTVSGKRTLTGGIYQLKQGQSRRIRVKIRQKFDDDSTRYNCIPFFIDSLKCVEIGGVLSSEEGLLDSYQEEDLNRIRTKWSSSLNKRRDYLTQEIQILNEKIEKTEVDIEREKNLYEQMILLTEELNFVFNPPHDSCLPGSTLSWKPEQGMEETIPTLFLDLDDFVNEERPEDSLSNSDKSDMMSDISGANCLLSAERKNDYHQLKLISNKKYFDSSSKIIESLTQWDSTIHESSMLNVITNENSFVYLTLKTNIKLAQPQAINILLRKRISVQIVSNENKKPQFHNLKSGISRFKSLLSSSGVPFVQQSSSNTNELKVKSTGVKYFIYTNIPRCIEELELKESLKNVATRSKDQTTFIDSYSKIVHNVDRLLKFDKIKQEFELKRAIEIENSKRLSNETLDSISSNHSAPLNQNRSSSISDFNGGKLTNLSMKFGGSIQNISQYIKYKTPDVKKTDLTTDLSEEKKQNEISDVIKNGIKGLDFGSSFMDELKNGFESNQELNETHEEPRILKDTVDAVSKEDKSKNETEGPQVLLANKMVNKVEEPNIQLEAEFKINNKKAEEQTRIEKQENSLEIDKNVDDKENYTEVLAPQPQKLVKLESFSLDTSINDSKSSSLNNLSPKLEIKKSKEEPKLPEWIKYDVHVIVTTSTVPNKAGVIRFIGPTLFAKGTWIGVELEREFGINDGSVNGQRYFQCGPNKGVFVKADKLTLDKFYYEHLQNSS